MNTGCPPTFASFFPHVPAHGPGLPVNIRRCSQAVMAVCTLAEMDDMLRRYDPERFSRIFLSPAEQETYRRFGYPKRRQEWLGGRLACKSALLDLLAYCDPAAGPAALSIGSCTSGAPVLEASLPEPACLPAISISHSKGYAVALAAMGQSCGIDIQQVTGQTERVRERFALTAELKLLRTAMPRLHDSERLSLLWAAKEAVKKALFKERPGFLQNIVLQSLACRQSSTFFLSCPGRKTPVEVTAVLLEGYALAFLIMNNHA